MVGSALDFVSDELRDLGKDEESLGELLRFDHRDAREVVLVKAEGKQRVDACVHQRI